MFNTNKRNCRWVVYVDSPCRSTPRFSKFLEILESYTPWVEYLRGCSAYLEFEDGWGENDGELVGDAQVVGGELVLDGSGDYVEILDDDSLDIVSFITMGVWAKGDVSNTGTRNIIGKSAADYLDGYELRFAGANFLSSNYGDGVEMHYSQPAYIQDINWHYYVISYDGARKRIYVDGVLFYEDGSDDIFSIDGNSLDLWIGQGRRNVGTWSGWIDDVMIFDRALSTEEVVAIYDVQRKV